MSRWERVRLGDVCEKGSSGIAQKDLDGNEGPYPIYGASGLIKHVDFYRQDRPYIAVVKDGSVGTTMLLPPKSSVISTVQYIYPSKDVDIVYLYYALTHMKLGRFRTGAVIPHIYFRDYRNELLPLPPLETQRAIAAALDQAAALLALRRRQIAKLELLVQAKFVELFGDPVRNEMGWETVRLDDVYTVKSSKRVYQSELTLSGIPFFRVSNLVQKINGAHVDADLFISEKQFVAFTAKGLVPIAGDILITTRGTLGLCYIVKEDDAFYFQDGMISWLAEQENKIDPLYTSHLFDTECIRTQIEKTSDGSTVNYLSLNSLRALQIPLPPLPLQQQFAAFVSQAEAQKQTLKQAQDKLQLQYDAMMQNYFG